MKRSILCRSSLASAIGLLISTGALADEKPHPGHAVPTSAQAELQMMDANKDGKVSSAEHEKGARAMFDAMDMDKNAVVTETEMDAAQKAVSKPGQSTPAKMTSAEKIAVVDTDGDGDLSAEEHQAGSRKMFATMDTDKDGGLTLAELESGRKMMLSSK